VIYTAPKSQKRIRAHGRVCDSWNHLPKDIVAASSLNILENKLDCNLRVNWGLKHKSFLIKTSPVWPPWATVTVTSGKLLYWPTDYNILTAQNSVVFDVDALSSGQNLG